MKFHSPVATRNRKEWCHFMNRFEVIKTVFQLAAQGWIQHRAQRLGASLAFYTTLALAPLTIIAIAVAGYFLGEEAARGEIVNQIKHLVGNDGAVVIETLLQKAREPIQSQFATMISIGLLIFGATGVFAELKDSLDTIWEVKRNPNVGFWAIAKTQLLAFAVVIGTGFLLLVSLILTALLTAFTQWIGQWLPGTVWTAYVLDLLASFLIITFLFALIFKLLPDVTMSWKDVWLGSVFTTVLFMIGKYLIGIYIGSTSVGSVYGAAGSLVVVMVWTYYSSQILYFGAELIRAYTQHVHSKPIVPTEAAVHMTEFDLTKQGMPTPPAASTSE
jgi:membrane protein